MKAYVTPFVVAALVAVLGAAPALADRPSAKQERPKAATMSCEIVEIEASTTGKPSIDPDLKDLEKKLKKGPFSAYDTFAKSARITKQLAVLKNERFATPKGGVDLIIRDVDKTKKRPRVSLGIRLEDETGKQYLETKMSADAGDYLLFARTVSSKQSIITAVGCK